MKHSDFVPFQQAADLKELGFNEDCLLHYNPNGVPFWKFMSGDDDDDDTVSVGDILRSRAIDYIEAPLWEQAFKWFRDKYNVYHKINLHDPDDEKTWRFQIDYIGGEIAYIHRSGPGTYFETYEEAQLACLIKLIEIVKTKKYDKSRKNKK